VESWMERVEIYFPGWELLELSWSKTSSLRLDFGQQEHICFDYKSLQGVLPDQNITIICIF
jgi:hypothetical protein